MKIKDQIVFVTGANRGIGKAYVEEFLKAGAAKIYLGVRDPKSVAEFVKQAPDKLIPIELDVTNPKHIEAAAKNAKDTTILINNAGVLYMGSVQDSDIVEKARKEMEVNYFAPLALIRTFAPILTANGGGAIATVSSIAGHIAFPGLGTYSASKAAIHSLIKTARMELSGQRIHVVGVYPGPINTDMAKDIEMDKFPPSMVAQTTIKAIENGTEDVFTDEFAQSLYAEHQKNPQSCRSSNAARL